MRKAESLDCQSLNRDPYLILALLYFQGMRQLAEALDARVPVAALICSLSEEPSCFLQHTAQHLTKEHET